MGPQRRPDCGTVPKVVCAGETVRRGDDQCADLSPVTRFEHALKRRSPRNRCARVAIVFLDPSELEAVSARPARRL